MSTALVADELTSRIDSLESRMSAIKTQTIKKTRGVQFSSANPQYDGYGLFLTADVLFWHLGQEGSEFSLSNKNSTLIPIQGKIAHSHFDWDFGFRAGVGYTFEHDAWDAYLNFTWFQTRASDTASAPHGGVLYPQKGYPLTTNVSTIHAKWHVHYSVLDLELGKSFFISKYLALRPMLGLESAWIDQRRHYHIHQPIDPLTFVKEERVHGKNNFWGLGPRVGIEGTGYFNQHWTVFGSMSTALLWGNFHAHQNETYLTITSKNTLMQLSASQYRLVPNIQTQMGFEWESNVHADRLHLGVKLAYCYQYWWRQNQFINEPSLLFNFEEESRNMSLQGVELEMRLDF